MAGVPLSALRPTVLPPDLIMARRTNYLVVVFLASVGVLLAAVMFGGGGGGDRPEVGAGAPDGPAAPGASDPRTAGVPGDRPAAQDHGGQDPSRTAVDTPPPSGLAQIVLSGRLVAGAADAPVDGVGLVWRARGRWGMSMDLVPDAGDARVETDAEGRFAMTIDAGKQGSLGLARESNLLFGQQDRRRVEVAAYEADADLGDLEVVGGATIVGRVIDETGQPLPAARVRANPDALVLWMPGQGQPVDGEGRFELKGLEPGTHRVGAEASGFVPGTTAVEVVLGVANEEVQIQLSRGASIAGTVLDDRGLPVQGAKVATFRNRTLGPDVEVSGLDGSGAVETDANGYFVLSGVEGRTASLRAWSRGLGAQTASDVQVGTSNLTIRLVRLGRIEGLLLDTDGEPIVGSDVSARTGGRQSMAGGIEALDLGQRPRAETDAEGRFHLDGVRPGTVALDARGPAHLPVEGYSVQLAPGATVSNVTLRADVGSAVAAQVFDAAGQPVVGATVTVREPPLRRPPAGAGGRRIAMRIGDDGGPPGGDVQVRDFDEPRVLRSGQTDAEGRVRLGGLPAGPAQVRAESDQHAASKPVQLSVPRRGTVDALLTLRSAGHVAVRSLGTTGEPALEVGFVLRGPQGASEEDVADHAGTTDAAGRARVGPLLAGRYTAVLRMAPKPMSMGDGMSFVVAGGAGEELASTQTEVTVEAGETAEVVLTQPMLARIAGLVRGATGPVVGAEVELRDPDAPPFAPGWKSKTGADGSYEIEDVPAGTYRLSWGKPRQLVPHEDDLVVPAGTPELLRDLEIRSGAVRVEVRSDIDGAPLARAEVSLRRPGAQPERRMRGIMMVTASVSTDGGEEPAASSITMGGRPTIRTDDDGIALLEDVPLGEFEVVVEHGGHVDGKIEAVEVVEGQVTEAGSVTLAAAGMVRGKVIGFPADAQMQIALVECKPVGSEDEPRRETAMQGSFEIGGLAPGDYELRAQQLGPGAGEEFGPVRRVTVRAGEPTRVELPLR